MVIKMAYQVSSGYQNIRGSHKGASTPPLPPIDINIHKYAYDWFGKSPIIYLMHSFTQVRGDMKSWAQPTWNWRTKWWRDFIQMGMDVKWSYMNQAVCIGLSTHHVDISYLHFTCLLFKLHAKLQDPCVSLQHAKCVVFHGFKSHGSWKYASLKHL